MSNVMSTSHAMSHPLNPPPAAADNSRGATDKASRKHPVLASVATVFIAAAGIAYLAGYLPVPSLILAAGTAYLAYISYLAIAFRHLIKDEMHDAVQHPQQAVDAWLGAGAGDVKPGSEDAAMHLELGTLSPAQVAKAAGKTKPATYH
jgi:hypothetical protein